MGKSGKTDFKHNILINYWENYRPATSYNSNIRKTSQQVVLELRPIAEFTVNEVSEFLNSKGYVISFDEDPPAWLMYQVSKESL